MAGLSYAEIAEKLDTSHSAVETLIFRARRHLATELQRVQTLLLGPLVTWLRQFFGNGAPGALRAGGVAVLAAGVTASAMVPASQKPARTGPHSVRAGTASVSALVVDVSGARKRPTRPAAAPRRHAALRRPVDVPTSSRAKADDKVNTQGTPPAALSAPTTTAHEVAPAPTAAGPTNRPAAVVQQVHTTTAAVVPLPAATLPGATVPAVTVPSVTVPSVTVPAVTTPLATTPSVTTPTVTTPTVTVPQIP